MLRYLSREDVERVGMSGTDVMQLLERAFRSKREGAVEMPPKIGVHPREDAFIHAMPAFLSDADAVGVKWVAGYPGNQRLGVPYLHGLLVLSHAETGRPLAVQELGTLPIQLFGTDEQKQRWLPPCASGDQSPAFALSEPEAGSDAGSMRTTAVRDVDEWVINGTKNWITNASIADFYVVFCSTDRDERRSTAFVVEADRPGFSVPKLEHKLGIRGSPTGTPVLEDVRVPDENRVGDVGKGLSVALATLERTRLGVAAQAVGIAQGATDYATRYAKERVTFGKPIAEHQAIQLKLAEMETRTAAARELLYRGCSMADRGEPGLGKYSSMAKVFASDVAMFVTVEAVQVLGGYGYVSEYPVERMMRDAKITQIYEGTNEIQRLVIARAMTAS